MSNMNTKHRKDRLVVMVSEAEKDHIHQEASQAGIGVGEYIRRRLLGSKSLDIEQRLTDLDERIQRLEKIAEDPPKANKT